MEWYEPLIIVAIAAFVITIFSIAIYRKVKGKGSGCCDCGCGKKEGCPRCHMK